MTWDEYQRAAQRTINKNLNRLEIVRHAVFGLASEAGEVASLFQKELQGHAIEIEHLEKEAGDCLWMLAELCTAYGLKLEDVAKKNIDKLLKRYPNGFDAERSLHRKAGDV